jgi:hypothetical protein
LALSSAVAHDKSGGEWFAAIDALRTFLDDPLHTDFEQFRYPTLVHEATHAVVTHAVGGAPNWIHEGLACYVERWDPTRSAVVNLNATKDWVRRPRALESARDAGNLPTFDALTQIPNFWVPDDGGPITIARYAAAESLFVYLADDPANWKLVGGWLNTARWGKDPAKTLTDKQRADIQKGWSDLVEFECGRIRTK